VVYFKIEKSQTKPQPISYIAYLHDKAKVAFLEGRLLSSQSEQSEKFSKSPDWLEKSRPSKIGAFVLIM